MKTVKPSPKLQALFPTDEVQQVLEDSFYGEKEPPKKRKTLTVDPSYRVVCISLYREDLDALDKAVHTLRARGYHRVSRSALVRHALRHLDLTTIPRPL
ncbi:MAG: ribbon-helix-helix domain-containing protein [Polyangiales bacterium]